MRLTSEQIEQFHRDGYLLVQDALSDSDLQPVIAEIEEAVDLEARRASAAGDLTELHARESFETRLTRITAETEKVYWAICSGQLAGPGIFGLVTHPKLLEMAEALVGPEIIASSAYRLRPKIPGFPHGIVPWHQDSGYFEAHCDRDLILTMWIPLVDATEERGCMQLIPGAHRGPVARHHSNRARRYLEILPEDLPEGRAETVPVRKGGVLLFTNRTPHQSIPNLTDVIRWSMDLRYQGAHLPHNFRGLRGTRAEADPPEGGPVACYPPEADFLVRSKTQPDDVVRDWETFHRIRAEHQARPISKRWEPVPA